eukprot:m.78690 g.78690  ORF g.78690 m.78690 type:complete len:84 (+) comp25141_c0_seq3:676-927(+)
MFKSPTLSSVLNGIDFMHAKTNEENFLFSQASLRPLLVQDLPMCISKITSLIECRVETLQTVSVCAYTYRVIGAVYKRCDIFI